jgi:mannose-6-phosphate isomerase-like protein (cupin superfamily)
MSYRAKTLAAAACMLLLTAAGAQTMKSDHWSAPELLKRAEVLKQEAEKGEGSASTMLEKYPHHYTMLAFRSRSGGAELHRDFADMFVILAGHTTLITGGTIEGAHATGEGETRGAGIVGGTRQELKAGDVVHIPAGLNHQMLVAEGETVTYFVTKVEESR